MRKWLSLALAVIGCVLLSGDVAVANRLAQTPSQVDSGKLKPTGSEFNLFGEAVAISGNTMIVGTPGRTITSGDEESRLQGAALVYTYTEAQGWTQQATLFVADAAQNPTTRNVGSAVAIDGDTALVGASRAASGEYRGGVWVFQRRDGEWTQQAQLEIENGNAELPAGFDIALSGNTAVIGQPAFGSSREARGEVYVFVRESGRWSRQATFAATDLAGASNPNEDNSFGQSVDIDGDTVVVGAPSSATGVPVSRGAVYVFTRTGTRWRQQAKLNNVDIPLITTTARMGASVAVEDDVLVAGAPGEGLDTRSKPGVVHIFVRRNDTWRERARLTSRNGQDRDSFGRAVDIANRVIVVGAEFSETRGESFSGEFYTFVPVAGGWFERGQFVAPDGELGDILGTGIATNGTIAAGGAPFEGEGEGETLGAVYWGPVGDLPEISINFLPLIASQSP